MVAIRRLKFILVFVLFWVSCDISKLSEPYDHDLSIGAFSLYPYSPVLKAEDFNADFAEGGISRPTVFRGADSFIMLVTARDGSGKTSIARAISSDLIHWTADASGPVIRSGEGGAPPRLGRAAGLYDGSNYRMWIAGGLENSVADQIYVASSSDGKGWTVIQGVYFGAGNAGNFDSGGVTDPYATIFNNHVYLLYTGISAMGTGSVGLADSANARDWNRSTSPVLAPLVDDDKTFDHYSVYAGAMLFTEDETGKLRWRLWYSGQSKEDSTAALGLAGSFDAKAFSRYEQNPIRRSTFEPCVIEGSGKYFLFFTDISSDEARMIQLATRPAIEVDDSVQ